MPAIKKYHLTLLLVPVIYLAGARWTPPAAHTLHREAPYPQDTGTFIGSAACQACHKGIYSTHIHTAHYLDSRPAAAAFIKGTFNG
jgi:hypothetical protein